MRVVARSTLLRFGATLQRRKDGPAAVAALAAWYHEVRAAAWRSPADIRSSHATASIIDGGRVVFNIKGNSYRLVVDVDYDFATVYIKWVGSHEDYDRIDVRTVRYADQTYSKR